MYRRFGCAPLCRPSFSLSHRLSPPAPPSVHDLRHIHKSTQSSVLQVPRVPLSPLSALPLQGKIISRPLPAPRALCSRAAPVQSKPVRSFSLRSEWEKARTLWVQRTSASTNHQIALWRFWLRSRWYNRYLALLVVIVVVLTVFIYWDNFISSDSPFGVVRRTIRYLETDPEVRAPISLAIITTDPTRSKWAHMYPACALHSGSCAHRHSIEHALLGRANLCSFNTR